MQIVSKGNTSILFSEKNKEKNNINLSSAEFAHSVLSVNYLGVVRRYFTYIKNQKKKCRLGLLNTNLIKSEKIINTHQLQRRHVINKHVMIYCVCNIITS